MVRAMLACKGCSQCLFHHLSRNQRPAALLPLHAAPPPCVEGKAQCTKCADARTCKACVAGYVAVQGQCLNRRECAWVTGF